MEKKRFFFPPMGSILFVFVYFFNLGSFRTEPETVPNSDRSVRGGRPVFLHFVSLLSPKLSSLNHNETLLVEKFSSLTLNYHFLC